MTTTVPAVFAFTPSAGTTSASTSAGIRSASAVDHREEGRSIERLSRIIFALNACAAASGILFLSLGLLPSDDRFFVWYFALFAIGLSCAVTVMIKSLAGGFGTVAYGAAERHARLNRLLAPFDSFWLLFFGLLCFISGAACGLVALSTSPGANAAAPADLRSVQPALTQAAAGYWEDELASAMLAGDQRSFLDSCDRLTDLNIRPRICDFNAGRQQGS